MALPKLSQFKTLDDLIAFYQAIPAKLWTKNAYKEGDKCCALGHLGVTEGFSPRCNAVMSRFRKIGVYNSLVALNDEPGNPRTNVLKYLRQIRNAQRKAAKGKAKP